MQLEQIILNYNNGLSNFANGATVWPPSTASAQLLGEGVLIHKIDLPTAALISTRIKYGLGSLTELMPGMDLVSYALACLAIESTLDPNCQNANTGVNSLGVARSNPNNDPMLYDMGIAQLKLEYIKAPGVVDHASALAFALDVDKAIPYFASIMADHVSWAQGIIAKNTSSAPDVRLSNPLLLATGAYNFGDTGMLNTYYETGMFPSHCQDVIDLEEYFSTKRGVPSIFADLPKAA